MAVNFASELGSHLWAVSALALGGHQGIDQTLTKQYLALKLI
jgi:hypothetical protein